MRKFYKCTFQTDTILTSSSATEGDKQPLNYISGNKFLGIVSKDLYDENNPKQTLDIFHNGQVSFGDAHPEYNGKRTFQVPFAIHYPKNSGFSNSELFLDYLLNKDDRENIKDDDIQLKQLRNGFFDTETKNVLKPDFDFSLKSAYDSKNRKSKEGQMFGYFGIKKGTSWIFYIDFSNQGLVDKVEKSLLGNKSIGRSKSAEYGRVLIESINNYSQENIQGEFRSDFNVIYAESNLCFYDKNGLNTLKPKAQDFGFEDGKIDWSKSYVRSRLYQLWNGKRHNRDADKWIIEKGSVFYVKGGKLSSDFNSEKTGSLISEGFGRIILNPDFLFDTKGSKLSYQFNKEDIKKESISKIRVDDNNQNLIDLLETRNKINKSENSINSKVNEFVENHKGKFKKISKSQWGQVRTYAKYTNNYETLDKLLFDKQGGFLYHGQTEKDWRSGREILKNAIVSLGDKKDKEDKNNDIKKIEFTIQLANQMAKTTKQEEDK